MNWRWNAILHAHPACAECGAERSAPCRNRQGFVCAPHRVRERVAAGDLFVISATDARRAKRIRAVRELAAACDASRRT